MTTTNLGLELQAQRTRSWHTLLNQNFQRIEDRLSTQYAGNPNGNVAGYWEGQFCYDTTNNKFYRCTSPTGVAATSVWTTLEDSFSLGALASLNTVGAAQIDSNAVTTAKIADGNVTGVKLNGGSNTPGNHRVYGTDKAGAFGFQKIGSWCSYQHQQTSGTTGPNPTVTVWTRIDMNAEVDDADGIGSISSGGVSLAAGTYMCWAAMAIQGIGGPAVDRWRLRLYNATDTSVIKQGVNGGALGSAVAGTVIVFGFFTIAGTKTIELQAYRTDGSSAITALTTGQSEVYAEMQFMKVG